MQLLLTSLELQENPTFHSAGQFQSIAQNTKITIFTIPEDKSFYTPWLLYSIDSNSRKYITLLVHEIKTKHFIEKFFAQTIDFQGSH